LIRRLHRDSNYTIVLIEHDMRVGVHLAHASACSTRADAGGGREEIDANEAVQAAYLGNPHDRSIDRRDLHTYSARAISHGVNLQVAEGRNHALLGRNGAGKTTDAAPPDGPDPARQAR